jgi:hypothetical protein
MDIVAYTWPLHKVKTAKKTVSIISIEEGWVTFQQISDLVLIYFYDFIKTSETY